MENASKALIMAAGILLGVLILTLMITLFFSARDLSSGYEERKQAEAIQQFNVNFIKFVGQDLSMHQVLTISNFAKIENNKVLDVAVTTNGLFTIDKSQIQKDISYANSKYPSNPGKKIIVEVVYSMQINYNDDKYISSILFYNRRLKTTTYNDAGKIIDTKIEIL